MTKRVTDTEAANTAFLQISDHADAARKLIGRVIGEAGDEVDDVLVAAQTLVSVIGYLADRSAHQLGGWALRGDADAWLAVEPVGSDE